LKKCNKHDTNIYMFGFFFPLSFNKYTNYMSINIQIYIFLSQLYLQKTFSIIKIVVGVIKKNNLDYIFCYIVNVNFFNNILLMSLK